MLESSLWIKKLDLQPHPEGGYYKELYRCNKTVKCTSTEGDEFSKERNLSTSIYYMLDSYNVSHFHRLKSDEIWYYHFGDSLLVHTFTPETGYNLLKLGTGIDKDTYPQVIIPSGTIFGAETENKNGISLIGCMVSSGFHFQDFELMSRDFLLNKYPGYKEIIIKLT